MRRWWCAAGGLGRRVLSSSTFAVASHARTTLSRGSFTGHRFFLSPSDGVAQSSHQQQVRHYAKRSRAPLTPIESKVMKYKIKAPSSVKFRFRTMKGGHVRRWRDDMRHNACLKYKEAKRRHEEPVPMQLYLRFLQGKNYCGYGKLFKKLCNTQSL